MLNFIYGTAWKEESTKDLVVRALQSGFRAIDTANQRKHYFEEAVGDGLQQYFRESNSSRSDLWIQTKFTYARGQDHRLPYNQKASYAVQVKQSLQSSLEHLKVNDVDSFLLHGPFGVRGLCAEDKEVWAAMEELVGGGRVKSIGLSNCSREQIEKFFNGASIKPAFLQNRSFAHSAWDREVREYCNENGIRYQAFSLLTANSDFIQAPTVQDIAKKYGVSLAQVIFRFAQQLEMIPLTGTSNEEHMRRDLESSRFELASKELKAIEEIAL